LICKTDVTGLAQFELFSSVHYYVGKIGYLPESGSFSRNNSITIILSEENKKSLPICTLEYNRVILGKKCASNIQLNPLWEDWEKYLLWLKEKGYFDKK